MQLLKWYVEGLAASGIRRRFSTASPSGGGPEGGRPIPCKRLESKGIRGETRTAREAFGRPILDFLSEIRPLARATGRRWRVVMLAEALFTCVLTSASPGHVSADAAADLRGSRRRAGRGRWTPPTRGVTGPLVRSGAATRAVPTSGEQRPRVRRGDGIEVNRPSRQRRLDSVQLEHDVRRRLRASRLVPRDEVTVTLIACRSSRAIPPRPPKERRRSQAHHPRKQSKENEHVRQEHRAGDDGRGDPLPPALGDVLDAFLGREGFVRTGVGESLLCVGFRSVEVHPHAVPAGRQADAILLGGDRRRLPSEILGSTDERDARGEVQSELAVYGLVSVLVWRDEGLLDEHPDAEPAIGAGLDGHHLTVGSGRGRVGISQRRQRGIPDADAGDVGPCVEEVSSHGGSVAERRGFWANVSPR